MSRKRILNIGIDLGTSRSVIACDNGVRTYVPSYVGYPKDAVSRKMFGKDIVFGDDVLKSKMALDVYRPFDKGTLKYSEDDDSIYSDKKKYAKSVEVARELLKHLVELAKEGDSYGYLKGREDFSDEYLLRGVLGAPALASRTNKKALLDIADGILDDVMIVSEPFCVAYGLSVLSDALIIDIGAGTVDLCRMHGTMPSDDDQITTLKAGDYVDQLFCDFIMEKYPEANFTVNMVKKFKEDNSTIVDGAEQIQIELPVKGKPTLCDVTDEIHRACRAIVPDIVEGIKQLVSTFDPEYQRGLKDRVILAGGGSQIVGLKKEIEFYMKEHLGYGNVIKEEEPLYAGANGALKLCKDMPDEYWHALKSKEK